VARQVEPAEDRADHRHDHILGQAGGDGRKGGADDHGDREVEHVAPGDEVAEFLQHGSVPSEWRAKA
jgi:hypothetical protein